MPMRAVNCERCNGAIIRDGEEAVCMLCGHRPVTEDERRAIAEVAESIRKQGGPREVLRRKG